MKKYITSLLLAATMLAPGRIAEAHHSMAMFDATKTITLIGNIKSFRWTSPHALIEITVQYKTGPIDWTVEMGNISGLMQAGWTPTTIKFGDPVKIDCHPLRSGLAGCNFQSLTLPDGKVMTLQRE